MRILISIWIAGFKAAFDEAAIDEAATECGKTVSISRLGIIIHFQPFAIPENSEQLVSVQDRSSISWGFTMSK
jgi:hypothetical protein